MSASLLRWAFFRRCAAAVISAGFAVAALVPSTAAVADPLVVAGDQPANPRGVEAEKLNATVAAPPSPIVAAPTRAQTPSARAPIESGNRKFYGWQNILVGELSLGAAALGALVDAGEPAVLGGLGYLVGGSIVHGIHNGKIGKIAGSLLINVLTPLGCTGIGALSSLDMGHDVGESAAIGAIAGLILAPVLDGVILGWEPAHAQAAAKIDLPAMGLSKIKGGYAASVGGVF